MIRCLDQNKGRYIIFQEGLDGNGRERVLLSPGPGRLSSKDPYSVMMGLWSDKTPIGAI